MIRTCESCGLSGDDRQTTFFQLYSGWRRLGGKAGALIKPRPEQRFACKPCVDGTAADGVMWQQGNLFDPA